MPRGLRSILGGELLREVVGLCAGLQQAALHAGKLDPLGRADVHLTRLRVLLRLVFDQKACSPAAYETAVRRADALGKMLGGWIRSVRAGAQGPKTDVTVSSGDGAEADSL